MPAPRQTRSRAGAAVPPATASATQSLDRALGLLDHVAASPRGGCTLTALVEASALSKPTVHRLMQGLRAAGLVDYDAAARRFAPSFKLYRMGLAAGVRFDIVELAAPSMDRLAHETGDTVYLSIRSGDQALCVARRVGSFPIKTLTLEVGDTRPLGLGAGSIALLSALDDVEREAVLERNRAQLEPHANFSLDEVRGYCRKARVTGWSINDGLMLPEMAAIGMLVGDGRAGPIAALSIASIRSRMQNPRRAAIVQLLQGEVAGIEALQRTLKSASPQRERSRSGRR